VLETVECGGPRGEPDRSAEGSRAEKTRRRRRRKKERERERKQQRQATTTTAAAARRRSSQALSLSLSYLFPSFFSFAFLSSLLSFFLCSSFSHLLLLFLFQPNLLQATSGNRTDVVAKKKINVAINGFGRIGRNFLRCVEGRGADSLLNVTVINDSGGVKQASHLLKYDSTLGTFNADVRIVDDSTISVNGKPIKIVSSRDPTQLPWGAENIDLVIEGTGVFISSEGAGKHLQAGAKKVLITAPAKGVSILGVFVFCFCFRSRVFFRRGIFEEKN
jgi:hypothetical protein